MKKEIQSKLRQIIREEVRRLREEKDLSNYVVKDGKRFYVDREDLNTGKTLVEPGDVIKFKHKGKTYKAEVMDDPEGRDDDVYRLTILV